MNLSQGEILRYQRHLTLPGFGEAGQLQLKAARVLIIGAGGLGCPALQYLAAAGVGTLGIVDDDRVSRSNLQRQILYTDADVGQMKADAAAEHLMAMNPDISAVPHATRLTVENAIELIGDYDAIITRSGTQVDAELLNHATKLKMVARAGVGIDNVDVQAASERGIIVVNAPFGNTNSAAEHSMAILLSMCRNVPDANASLKSGQWQRAPFTGYELKHKTMGIIGLGKVGGRVALRSRAFEMDVIVYDPYISEKRATDFGTCLVSLDELISTADVISVHTPLNDETSNLITAEHFTQMKDGVLIVNCARGGIVDEMGKNQLNTRLATHPSSTHQ